MGAAVREPQPQPDSHCLMKTQAVSLRFLLNTATTRASACTVSCCVLFWGQDSITPISTPRREAPAVALVHHRAAGHHIPHSPMAVLVLILSRNVSLACYPDPSCLAHCSSSSVQGKQTTCSGPLRESEAKTHREKPKSGPEIVCVWEKLKELFIARQAADAVAARQNQERNQELKIT